MNIQIRQVEVRDIEDVSSVLNEAADWLRECGIPMWRADELTPERITADVARGEFFIAEADGQVAGVVKFQLRDDLFWPDTPADEAAFVHRLAVRRAFADGRLSGVMLQWAADRAHGYGRRFLRLDCKASRARLRAIYERFGFRQHSDRQVGPYFVSRYELALMNTPDFKIHGLDHVQLAMPAGQETLACDQTLRQAMPCVIREASIDDAPAIESLYRELVSDPLIRVLPEQIAALSDSPTSFLLVAEVEGAFCATALVAICPDAMYRTQPFGVVENVVVTQAMRGRGIGHRLLEHVEQLAIAHDCTKLMLLSSTARQEAHAFFRRCGFADDSKHAFVKYRRQFTTP